jgi:ketosteroid isomerase-like protein
MLLSKAEIHKLIKIWLVAWDEYNLDNVMKVMHDEVVFENWTGAIVCGKNRLRISWMPWFNNHQNFKFTEEDLFIDEQEQKVLFQWKLEWPIKGKEFNEVNEIRRGVDVIHFRDEKIYRKKNLYKDYNSN